MTVTAAALAALPASLLAIWALRKTPAARHVVAAPRADRWHTRSTPLLGGSGIFAGILVLHIVFVLFKATPTNGIVKHVNSYAHHLAGPFRTLFDFKSKGKPNVKLTETVNYGIAALVYLFGGRLLAGLLRRLAP